MSNYRGFSSHEFKRSRNFKLEDVELVKMDLLNHIFTRFGSRVRESNFGSTIPDMLMQPLDEFMIEDMVDSLQDVFKYDPRVDLVNMTPTADYENNTLTVNVTLLYIEFNITDDFNLNLEFSG